MKKIVVFIFSIFDKIFFLKKENKYSVLVPPVDLTGSFGDELMLTAIAQYCKEPLLILSHNKIVRNDLFGLNTYYSNAFSSKLFRYYKIKRIIAKSKIIYIFGADVIDGGYSKEFSDLSVFLISQASKMKKNIRVVGFSLNRKNTYFLEKINELHYDKCHYLIRDINSFDLFNSKCNNKNVTLVGDSAFLAPIGKLVDYNYLKWIQKQKRNDKLVIGFCPNSSQAIKFGISEYLICLENILILFNKKINISIALLYHDLRASLNEYEMSNILYERLAKKGIDCFPPPICNNGNTMKAYIKEVDFTLTGRLHFGISGLAHSKPMFGITYNDKFEGIIKMFKISPDLCLINYHKINDPEDCVMNFINNYDLISSLIHNNLLSIKTSSELNIFQDT